MGRCLAEQLASGGTLALTLTYAGDGPETASLRYSDVQKFLKRLRADGHRVRYIVAGEYGEKKGRAHWHVVLFFKGNPPPFPGLEMMGHWPYWPHGHVYFQNADQKGFRYILKYALKQNGHSTRQVMMSKKPPLGHDFFLRMAEDAALAGLPLHSPAYSFLGVKNQHGQHKRFWLQGRMRELMLEHYCARWRELYGSEPPETPFLMERYLDKLAAKEMEADRVRSFRALEDVEIRAHVRPGVVQLGMLALPGLRGGLVVANSNFTADIHTGSTRWLITKPGASESAGKSGLLAQLRRVNLRPSEIQPVLEWLDQQWSAANSTP